MAVNYFCSGFDKDNAFWQELGERLREDLPSQNRIVFIPGSTKKEKIDKTINEKIPQFKEHFKKVGIEFKDVKCITPNTNKEDAQEWIINSDFIMLMGGNPFLQKDLIEVKGLSNLIKNYNGVIMGFSAGAMNMSKYIIITPCSEEYPEFDVRVGLNLSEISIYPHNNFDGDIFPKEVHMGDEVTVASDLNIVAKQYGNFYCLQDHLREDNTTSVSLIRTTPSSFEILTNNNGRVWEVTPTDFNLIDTNNLKKTK